MLFSAPEFPLDLGSGLGFVIPPLLFVNTALQLPPPFPICTARNREGASNESCKSCGSNIRWSLVPYIAWLYFGRLIWPHALSVLTVNTGEEGQKCYVAIKAC